MRRFDVVVVGAGPAGSSAACVAAHAGLRVALIDKARFPRTKLCGGGLTGRALKYYADAFGPPAPDVPLRSFDAVEFWAFGTALGKIDGVPPLRLCMRHDLDTALLAQALQAGAEDMTGQAVKAVDPASGTVTTTAGQVQAGVIVAADGVNSPIARQVFGAAFDRDEIGFALEIEHPVTGPDDALRIDFGAAEWGYGWHFPKAGGVTVGVGGVLSRNPDMRGAMQDYTARLGLPPAARVQGQFLPFGRYRCETGVGRVLFAGDAAGLVDPITGEGIAYAIRSGDLAARAAIAEMANGPRAVARRYWRSLRQIHRSIRIARMLRPLLFGQRFQGSFVRGFRASSTLRREYLRLLAGDTEYPQLMAAVLGRLPAHLVRSWAHYGSGRP